VLSMFERWIGEDRFRAGVRAYIARHAGGNASAGDFLEALAKVSSPELRRSFAAFLDQPGVPLVRLSMSCEGHPRLRVRQERLAEVPLPGAAESTGGAPWPLPVCVRHGGAGKPVEQCQLVDSADTEISLDAAACPAWLVGNAGAAGYYRVAYDDDLTQRILRALPRLALTERLAIASDAGALVALGHADLASAFEIAGGLLATGEGRSVAAAIELIADTRSLVDTPALPRWRRHVTRILGARAHALDLARPPKAAVDRQIWTRLVRTMALLVEDPALLAQARTLIERWLAGKGGVADDDLDLVLSVAARGGDAALFERLLAAAQASKDEHVRDELFASLGQFRDRALVDRTLRLLLDPKIDIGRVRGASQALFSRRDTQAQAWAFFKDNVDAVVPRLPKHVQERLPRVTSAFCEADLRRDVEAFFAPRVKGAAAGQRALTEALADIDRCMARRARNGAAVEALLGK